MTQAAATETLHLEGGPLDGQAMTVPTEHGQTFVNALAFRRPDGNLADPRVEMADRGLEADLPLSAWPPDIKASIVPIEYHIDPERGVAVFREPATIRESSPREAEREWVAADARKSQQPRWLAWKAAATRLSKVVGSGRPEDCQHEGGRCQTDAMHVARLAVDAIIDDGLHITEPTRLTDGGDALAFLIHDATDRLAVDHGYGSSRTPWSQVPEQARRFMAAVAADVLGHLDAQGRVVTITMPEDAPPDLDFHGLGDVLREEAGASLLLALPKALGLTIETVDEERMRAAGWVRVTPGDAERDAVNALTAESLSLPAIIVASCPVDDPEPCRESFTIAVDYMGDAEAGRVAVDDLGVAMREHLDADHNGDRPEITVQAISDDVGALPPVTLPAETPTAEEAAQARAALPIDDDPHPEEQHAYGAGCDVCDGNACPYCKAEPKRVDADGTFVWDEHQGLNPDPLDDAARCPGSGLPVGQPK